VNRWGRKRKILGTTAIFFLLRKRQLQPEPDTSPLHEDNYYNAGQEFLDSLSSVNLALVVRHVRAEASSSLLEKRGRIQTF
jgi:hypothetical protein